MAEKKNYKDTLNLPKTSLNMKANLVQREPQLQKQWQQMDLYGQIQGKSAPGGRYFLHDGPPYANGDIHMGHLINKVLKDMVVKYRTMAGYKSPYIPGWDCHGLPIEQKVMQELGAEAAGLTQAEIRKRCDKYARKWVKTQSQQFARLGILGDFKQPYLTLNHSYEAGVLECLARCVERGVVYRQKKPIHWSYGCRTALAEAELEYEDIAGPSIFVNLPASGDVEALVPDRKSGEPLHLMIWTTTPWTLPANLAVMVGPEFKYQAVRYEFEGETQVSIIAAELVERVMKAGKVEHYEVVNEIAGSALVGTHYSHPFIDRVGLVVESQYVSLEEGTGLVHCAPGHGQEDYIVGLRNGLEPYSPIDEDARFDDSVPDWIRGMFVFDANPIICARLEELGLMYQQGEIVHSYPHCWRSKTPVVFRATEQWFIAVDKPMTGSGKTLRQTAIDEAEKVEWIPGWGRNRILGMLQSRPDWCISRQRSWGVPIPAFYCESCGETLMTAETVRKVRDHFAAKGADSWFRSSAADILGPDAACPSCGSKELKQESDILDVWFESGSSWLAAAEGRDGLEAPVELYLEGSDQHRGWFQSSLLIGVAATDKAPFKTVLTHGFVVDAKGYKMSKSLGNTINVQDEVAKLGADVLRLWVSSVDYQYDIRTSQSLIEQLQEAYRKVRNTFRFLLGNLADFDPARHMVEPQQMHEFDRYMLARLAELIDEATAAMENFEFHRLYQMVHLFCNRDLSGLYLDVQKDAVYCDAAEAPRRRSAQSFMYLAAHNLVRLLAPVLTHTADEIWSHIAGATDEAASVHLTPWPTAPDQWRDKPLADKWNQLREVRLAVNTHLEGLRSAGTIQSNMEAAVTLRPTTPEMADLLNSVGETELARFFIAATVTIEPTGGEPTQDDLPLAVGVARSEHEKCERCWNLRPDVTADEAKLCGRCRQVVGGE